MLANNLGKKCWGATHTTTASASPQLECTATFSTFLENCGLGGNLFVGAIVIVIVVSRYLVKQTRIGEYKWLRIGYPLPDPVAPPGTAWGAEGLRGNEANKNNLMVLVPAAVRK